MLKTLQGYPEVQKMSKLPLQPSQTTGSNEDLPSVAYLKESQSQPRHVCAFAIVPKSESSQ